MVLRVTGVASGKKDMMKTRTKKRIETSLIGPPHLPKLQRATGRDSLRQRLIRMQVIETMYEDRRAAVPSEAMALNAVVDPMLIIERRMVIQKDTMTEFRGISQPGRTWEVPSSADIRPPVVQLRMEVWTYVS